MLVVESVSKELGGRLVLENIRFAVNPGEVVGIVGANGSGKTTLLRIMAGEERPDGGRVELPRLVRVGYLPQGRAIGPGTATATCFPRTFAGAGEDRLSAVAAGMAGARDAAELARLSAEYDALLAAPAGEGGVDSGRLKRELRVDGIAPGALAATLSGGEMTRLGLVEVAASSPGVLLLDEPTNHLDVGAIEWVQRYIAGFRGPVVVVSHDRSLLDACATAIVEIDARTHRAEMFAGNYTAFAEEKARREATHWQRYEQQQKEERHLRSVISNIETRARGIEQSTIDFAKRKKALKIARRAVTLRSRIERKLESAEHVERPGKALAGLEGRFRAVPGGSTLLTADGVALAVAERTLVSGLTFHVDRGARLAVVGPNGSGKTTLLRAIQGEHALAAGELRLAGSAVPGYLPQQQPGDREGSESSSLTPVEAIRRVTTMTDAEANNFLHRFLLARDQLRTPLGQMSYGERRRFALSLLIAKGTNLLLLDEPANHLDLPSREAFEAALEAYEGAAIIVTHDRYFVERYASDVLDFARFGAKS